MGGTSIIINTFYNVIYFWDLYKNNVFYHVKSILMINAVEWFLKIKTLS